LDVAREQNHAGWLQTLEQGTEARVYLHAIKTDDQKLAELF
jgi:hypothetical protein